MRVLRWILVIPVVIVSFAAVLLGAPLVGLYLSEAGIVPEAIVLNPSATVIGAIVALSVNFCLGGLPTSMAMKTAPAHHRAVGAWMLILLAIITAYQYFVGASQPGTLLLFKDLAVVVGAWTGYRVVAGTWNVP